MSNSPTPSAMSILQSIGSDRPFGGRHKCPICEANRGLSLAIRNDNVLAHCHARQCDVHTFLRGKGVVRNSRPIHDEPSDDYRDYRRLRKAVAIMRAANGDAAALSDYFRGRGIDNLPNNALFLSAREARRIIGKGFPAMVLPVAKDRKLVGCHLTLLTSDASKRIKNQKRMYGPIKGGHVQLGRPKADKSLVVGEGIESALSAAQITGLPAIAALSATSMKALAVPSCSEVIIAADNDAAGLEAARLLAQCLLDAGHRVVRIAAPDKRYGNDWNDALNSGTDLETLRDELLHAKPVRNRGVRALRARELMKMTFSDPEYLLRPWLEKSSLCMVHAARGSGKTWFCGSMAVAIASGQSFLGWTADRQAKVLYVDGEMGRQRMQSRLGKLGPCPLRLWLLMPDQFRTRDQSMPDIATLEGQKFLDKVIEDNGIEVIILDSLTALVRSGVENEAESWLPIQSWALNHRWRGRTVIFVHHDNRLGKPRGSSKREDVLDTMIGLKARNDLAGDDESVFEQSFTKSRSFFGADAKPRIIRLSMVSDRVKWSWEEPLDQHDRIRRMLDKGFKQVEIAKRLDLTTGRISQIVRDIRMRGKTLV